MSAEQEITAQNILGQSLDRNRYFYGKLMTVRDFKQEQLYFNAKRWLINRMLFGSGVIWGLQVEKSGTDPTAFIVIKPGLAFDPFGREVAVLDVPGGNKFDLRQVIGTLAPPVADGPHKGFICLSYYECPKEPVPSLKSSPCDEACESNRWSETFDVSWEAETSIPSSPALCEKWLNRTTLAANHGKLRLERTTPLWVRVNEVFEVVVRVTNIDDSTDAADVQIKEKVTDGFVVEPTPAALPTFPTAPVNLRAGEFFVYAYQVRSTADEHADHLSIDTDMVALPTLHSKVSVLSDEAADQREREFEHERNFDEPSDSCVPIAELTVQFAGNVPVNLTDIRNLTAPRFRYSLERVTEMLDCLRASVLAEAGAPRPGHSLITFKDLETRDPKPIGTKANHGEAFTVSRGDHVHKLPLTTDGGLVFDTAGELLIEGMVKGEAIDFQHPVLGQEPEQARHLVTKHYVDSHLAGLDWKESVLRRDLTAPPTGIITTGKVEGAPQKKATAKAKEVGTVGGGDLGEPKGPQEGDRHLLFNEPDAKSEWAGKKDKIATFNGKEWEFTTATDGAAVFVENENLAFLYVKQTDEKGFQWVPFLTTPDVAAGDGLVASGAILSVGQGKGILVNPNEVEIAYGTTLPRPISSVASIGSADAAARGDHAHELPLATDGGLAFDKAGGLLIDGRVNGEAIDFQHPVTGISPTSGNHLATKQYVDEHEPTIKAGNGLTREGDVISVVQGSGIQVDSDVAVAFESGAPRPIGPLPSAGKTDTVSRGNHVHQLPLAGQSGLEFKADGLRINGQIAGEAIDFQSVVSGQPPTGDRHLVTKKYVDDKVVPPPKIVAGKGLFIDADNSLAVGHGAGITVSENDVNVTFEDNPPRTIGPRESAGTPITVSAGDHVHALPLGDESGLVFDDKGLRIDGPVRGREIKFSSPVAGRDPEADEHLATRKYVDDKVVESPPVVAGDGLFEKQGNLAVGQGDGVIVGTDNVSVRFSDATPHPDSSDGGPGIDTTVSRSDHAHPLPANTTGATTGVVTLRLMESREGFTGESGFIDPRLGHGIISVQIAQVTDSDTYVFGFDPVVGVQMSTAVKIGSPGTSTMFQVSVRSDKPPSEVIQMRWFAFSPVDIGETKADIFPTQ
jgi:hypothetical protein